MIKASLETPRLFLRTLDAGDTEMFFDFLVRNADHFKPWSALYEKDYFSIWYHRQWLETLEREMNEGRQMKFGVFLKHNDSRIIGTVSFSNIIGGIFQSCFLGYRFDKDELRKGYATEAIAALSKYVFSEIKLHRIEANIMPSNTASIGLVEKLGFVNEGLAKKYLKIDGNWEDHLHYVLLNNQAE